MTVILKDINEFRFALSDVADAPCNIMLYVFELREDQSTEGRPYVSCAANVSTHLP